MSVDLPAMIKNTTMLRLLPLLAALALIAPRAHADPLSDFLDGLSAYSARFEQVATDANGLDSESSSGTLLIQRPNRFRWEYEAPYPQLILADGRDLYLYDPDLEQVTVKPMDAGLRRTPALLLTGDRPIAESFIVGAEERRDGLVWVDLRPRGDAGEFDTIWVGFRDNDLAAMQIVDGFGQTTRMYFRDGRRDPEIADAAFVFAPPPGTDVIRAPREE